MFYTPSFKLCILRFSLSHSSKLLHVYFFLPRFRYNLLRLIKIIAFVCVDILLNLDNNFNVFFTSVVNVFFIVHIALCFIVFMLYVLLSYCYRGPQGRMA